MKNYAMINNVNGQDTWFMEKHTNMCDIKLCKWKRHKIIQLHLLNESM